jgi:hypothetical protein
VAKESLRSRQCEGELATTRRNRNLLAIGLAVGIVLAAIPEVLSRGEEDRPISWPRAEFFGVNAPLLRDYAMPERAESLDALAAGLGAAGVSWARVVFDQAVEQPAPGPINWFIPDRVVGALARHGVRTNALFIGTPPWVAGPSASLTPQCGPKAAPADEEAWSRFVGAAVVRYGRNGDFWKAHPEIRELPIETWEIGNEQNLRMFWCPRADPEAYASIYSASRAAALEADPRARVIIGGLAPTFSFPGPGDMTVGEFLRRMVEAEPELRGEIPAVGIHPYGSTVDLVMAAVRRFRQAMESAGLGTTPMLANEVGWYTSGPPGPLLKPDLERAQLITQVTLDARRTDCGLIGLGVHSWQTAQLNPENPEDWYGLADPFSGAPNESGRAYAAAIAAAGGSGAGSAGGRLSQLCG